MNKLKNTGLLTKFIKYFPKPASESQLKIVHDPLYIRSVMTGVINKEQQLKWGLPWSARLRDRSFISPNGTLLAAQLALQTGIACHAAGGTHHAHKNFGAGFCIFNDLAFTARALVQMGLAKTVLILDCDVHQGDGTATILKCDKNIFTCSIHCKKNYPTKKANSDLDYSIEEGCGDEQYLAILHDCLKKLERIKVQPDLLLYDAGVDVHINDKLGFLKISSDGIEERDKMVLSHYREKQIPIATVIGGGYEGASRDLANRHSLIFKTVASVFCL